MHPLQIRSSTIELEDSSQSFIDAEFLISGRKPRDINALSGRLAEQFIRFNLQNFQRLNLVSDITQRNNQVLIKLKTQNFIGAIPLFSPTTYAYDYSLIIKPRFGWAGMGSLLSEMGWKVLPEMLKLPQLPHSEKKIPPWVLSSVILFRIRNLLREIHKNFQFQTQETSVPKGKILWNQYIEKNVVRGNWLSIPCRFPELSEDEKLKGNIHYILLQHLHSLQSQLGAGIFLHRLIEECKLLLTYVRDTQASLHNEYYKKFMRNVFTKSKNIEEGIEAIDWTVQQKGLAGLGETSGLPWILNMESFFEAWIESIAEAICLKTGYRLKSGRKRETITSIKWEPSYRGSQKFLLPDVVLRKENKVIIIDAKYKEHWIELNQKSWNSIDKEIQERHREDLLQVLAYSSLQSSEELTCILIYPCEYAFYKSLKEKEEHYIKAEIYAEYRKIQIYLLAAPLSMGIGEISKDVVEIIKKETQ
ncbi:MAG: hypothetical protein H7A25_14245 [Leptospiraceae bacterium]|nr:hypothetical protein [Leptospiraceae bacterium]MCP5501064.1 hypothetical protein [Leptospiraceae bacterium]